MQQVDIGLFHQGPERPASTGGQQVDIGRDKREGLSWRNGALGLVLTEDDRLDTGVRELLQYVPGVGTDAAPKKDRPGVEAYPHATSRSGRPLVRAVVK